MDEGRYTISLLLAEGTMALAALAGGCGLLTRHWWGVRVAHLGIGLMVYSTIYTLGFSLLRESFLTPIMVGGLAGSLLALALLWHRDGVDSFD